MTTKEIIDRIFKDPKTKYELTEFENIGKPVEKILDIYPKTIQTGREAGKTKHFLKSFIPFSSGNEEVQVYVDGGKSAPEEIVRQLWVYKLLNQYGYKIDEIDLEKSVQFGTEIGTKAADIIVYTDATKVTPKIIVECKKPNRKDGIEQLKSYMNAKGAPVAVWSNGSDSIILYRPYPKEFDDTLFDIPKRGQAPKDVLEAKKTLLQLKKDFDFKKIIQDLEELVLANSGKNEFNEIFKLIFAKIWDEKEAHENRKDKTVEFGKALDPDITYDRINTLFRKAGLHKTSSSAYAAETEAHIRSNDLLVYTTGAYVGRTNVYLSEHPALASNHVNILRLSPRIDSAYMALVFQSVIGQFQTQKHARGSAQAELYPSDIDRFVVPLIDHEKQKEIGDLVRDSLKKQQESKQLLEHAKTRVEQLIEEAVKR